MTSQLLVVLTAAGLVSVGVAAASETRSFAVLPAATLAQSATDVVGSGQKCRVNILRSGPAGTAQVTRAVLDNGDCICNVTTGAQAANGSAENVVIALLRDRECAGAPPAGNLAGQVTGAAGSGSMGSVLPVVLGAAAAGGLAAGLGSSSKG